MHFWFLDFDHQNKAYPYMLHTWMPSVIKIRPSSSNKWSFKPSAGFSANLMLHQGVTHYTRVDVHYQGRCCIAPQTVFQWTWSSIKTFLLTQKFGTAWAGEMTAYREEWLSFLWVVQLKRILGQEHLSSWGQVFHHVQGSDQQPTDHNQTQLRS